MKEGKSVKLLMEHMRSKHDIKIGIDIEHGDRHEIELKNLGYYHGFKAYKFVKHKSNELKISNFNEIIYINQFDMELKSLIYPKIMFLESSIKNHTLEAIFKYTERVDFNSIYNELLTAHKEKFVSSSELNKITSRHKQREKEKKYKDAINKRLNLRTEIYRLLNMNFNNNVKVIQHFYNQNKDVPIWATFEVMMMGNLGSFISCLDKKVRDELSRSLKLNLEFDANREFAFKIIYALKDLRNAIAHNNVIFDARFRTGDINKMLIQGISKDTMIVGITFDTLIDYIILIAYLLKGVDVPKTEIEKFISDFEVILNSFRAKMNISNYNKIIDTDTRNKINKLNEYILK